MIDPHKASYMAIRLLTAGEIVHRTADVVEGKVMADLDAGGKVIGIERLDGPVDLGTLGQVIRWLAAPPGESEHQYGFTNVNTGEFVHHGDENQARALASVVKRPILRRQVWYGPIEPVDTEVVTDGNA